LSESEADGPVLVWFRRDLRLADNPALSAAAAAGRSVIPVYVLDQTPAVRPIGAAGAWWLNASLCALAEDLNRLGSRLVLRRGPASATLTALVEEVGASAVFWNRLYDPGLMDEDRRLETALGERGVEVRTFKADLLLEPWELRTKTDGFYQVFTPFWRAAKAAIHAVETTPAPKVLPAPRVWPQTEGLASWGLHPKHPDWSSGFNVFSPGEAGARAALDRFLDGPVEAYAEDRNRPDRSGVSRLSPHLHWGEIGPNRVWSSLHAKGPKRGGEVFLSELGWREFNHHLLFHRPDLPERNFKSGFDAFPWRDDPRGLKAWRQGRTGYPMVDAGMRELWSTGYMHNRVRMIAASFLIKHLLIDWRAGERWFWDTLLDASPANNVLNWQWVAGSGADAAPFFRIFNPVTQGHKFDPDGAYVRRWVPELSALPAPLIHSPWMADAEVLAGANIALGETYPHPIVDHDMARRRALQAYEEVRGQA
jgi:deoxyribodipyrimidine photo-lyase